MLPPETVKVGPHEYTVAVVPNGALSDAGRVGQCVAQRLVISLCDQQEQSQLADTLLHELVHAILETVPLDRDVEEQVCLALGPGLLGLLKENPGLVRWLTR